MAYRSLQAEAYLHNPALRNLSWNLMVKSDLGLRTRGLCRDLSCPNHLSHSSHQVPRLTRMCRMRPSKKKLCRTERLRLQNPLCLNPVPQKQGVHHRGQANCSQSLKAMRLANLWTRGLCHEQMRPNKLRSFNQRSHPSHLSKPGHLSNQGHPSNLIYLSHHSQLSHLSELRHPSHSSH